MCTFIDDTKCFVKRCTKSKLDLLGYSIHGSNRELNVFLLHSESLQDIERAPVCRSLGVSVRDGIRFGSGAMV